jgi:predicted lipoprotein with Yx(FWY)xxD motif
VKRVFPIIFAVVALVSLAGLSGALAATDSQSGTRVSAASSSLGRIIVDGRGRTLYLFEKDKRGHSACSGACAMYWPPVITHGKPIAGQGVKTSLLGTIRRANGARQVTYAGHPLYRYLLDTKSGQTNGEGLQDFGGGWEALSPAGKKIERGSDG